MQPSGVRRVSVLVVFVLIGIAVALAVPGIQQAREEARVSQCQNNVKAIGLALSNYHDVFRRFPYGAVGDSQLPPERRWSWYPQLIPYLEAYPEAPIPYFMPSDDPANWPVQFIDWDKGSEGYAVFHMQAPESIICPNGDRDVGPRNQALTSYVGMAGIGEDAPLLSDDNPRSGVWGYERQTAVSQIAAVANTILTIETAYDRGLWLSGGPATVRGFVARRAPLNSPRQFGGFHPGVTVTGFADASVRTLSNSIDPDTFARMTTIAGDQCSMRSNTIHQRREEIQRKRR